MSPRTNESQESPARQLRQLAEALNAAGLAATIDRNPDGEYVRVVNTGAVPELRDRVTIQNNYEDGYKRWFYTSWRHPVAPMRDIETAVKEIRVILTPKPGSSHVPA